MTEENDKPLSRTERLEQRLRDAQAGKKCPRCEDAGLYWDEQTQDVESCDFCEELIAYIRDLHPPARENNVIRLYRNPGTGRLDTIPF